MLSFHVFGESSIFHLLSHLIKMLFHYLLSGFLVLVVYSFAEFYHICGVYVFFEVGVTHLTHTFVGVGAILGIGVGHVET